jgi:hypothetical protein
LCVVVRFGLGSPCTYALKQFLPVPGLHGWFYAGVELDFTYDPTRFTGPEFREWVER